MPQCLLLLLPVFTGDDVHSCFMFVLLDAVMMLVFTQANAGPEGFPSVN